MNVADRTINELDLQPMGYRSQRKFVRRPIRVESPEGRTGNRAATVQSLYRETTD